MFDDFPEEGCKRPADSLTALVDQVSSVVSPNAEKVSPVSDSSATVRDLEKVSGDVPEKGDIGKGHKVDSRRC